jgi:hypothetical protein
MKRIYSILILLISLKSFSQVKKFKDYNFKELLIESNLSFNIPRGFKETNIIQDNGQFYQFAIKDSLTGFEARYYIKPYSLFFSKNDKTFKEDSMTYNFFVTSLLNVSGYLLPNIPRIEVANPEYVKYDINADYGLSSFFEPKSKFGEGYKYCISIAIRKDGVGEVFIFMLYNIQNHETKIIIDDIFSSIDFK